jgi:hypothetical protein
MFALLLAIVFSAAPKRGAGFVDRLPAFLSHTVERLPSRQQVRRKNDNFQTKAASTLTAVASP